jgi:hypothetical protein
MRSKISVLVFHAWKKIQTGLPGLQGTERNTGCLCDRPKYPQNGFISKNKKINLEFLS